MREELDEILAQLGCTWLTNAEWAKAASVLDGRDDNKAKYQALFAVLSARGGVCDVELQNLDAYFKARGLTPADLEKKPGFSNIFLGAALE